MLLAVGVVVLRDALVGRTDQNPAIQHPRRSARPDCAGSRPTHGFNVLVLDAFDYGNQRASSSFSSAGTLFRWESFFELIAR